MSRRPPSAYVFFRDSAFRRTALAAGRGAPERYALFGFDELVSAGVRAAHNLDEAGPPRWARLVDRVLNRLVYGVGGYGGDFAGVVPHLREANRAAVVLSTVDTVGIPLLLLRRTGLLRAPLVYVSIGLPERLDRLRGPRVVGAYRSALRSAAVVVAYSLHECAILRELLGDAPGTPEVRFVPFGVDESFFCPVAAPVEDDVVSIGVDPRRDFALLLRIAERRPELKVRVVASGEHVRRLAPAPPNVALEADIPLRDVRARLAAARVVALPVRENSYSGATTALLQAMAMAKPVVVSRTRAIQDGYGLVDGGNCRLVPPGDQPAFASALDELLGDVERAAALGAAARATVERGLTWDAYAGAIADVLAGAAR